MPPGLLQSLAAAWLFATMAVAASPKPELPAAEDFATVRSRAVKREGLEAYNEIIIRHQDDQGVRQFLYRLGQIDELVGLLTARLDAVRSSAVDNYVSRPATAVPAIRGAKLTMSAADVLDAFVDDFSTPLARPDISDDDFAVLRDYYATVYAAAEQFVMARGRLVVMVDKNSSAFMVLPFLRVSDREWSNGETQALPDWLRQPSRLAALEGFALSVRRPQTAYQLALAQAQPGGSMVPATFIGYVPVAVEKCLAGHDYQAAIQCVKVGIDHSADKPFAPEALYLRFRLGELLDQAGYPQLAAVEMRAIVAARVDGGVAGRAAALHLRYLYSAKQYDELVKKSEEYQTGEPYREFLSSILYVTWAAHRATNNTVAAEAVQKRFLSQFPDDPLAAEIYFARAVAARAEGNYDECVRLLEMVEYKFPQSKVLPSVKRMRQSLAKARLSKPQEQ